MREFVKIQAKSPVEFHLGGHFISKVPWIHAKRTLHDHEVIVGIEGALYMEIEEIQYEVRPGDILIMPANMVHTGYKHCSPGLSFYWFHFSAESDLEFIDENKLKSEITLLKSNRFSDLNQSDILLPIYSKPKDINRIHILFHQLLDIANSNYFNRFAINYLATSLLIELSEQFITKYNAIQETSLTDKNLLKVMEWIRLNASDEINVSSVADYFNYNPNYLSRMFKEKTGKNIKDYIQSLKIVRAKDLLIRTNESIRDISNAVGISDEKYFMRLFKKFENLTPTEFRKAYCRKTLNKE
ncbi:AraC family transcriptional regulator [Litchfieldia salsa]|uniref:AraC-like ligand binding domain-containing protein n=1 Tax=Litchfieldia salsa TaxID=930152 RepID=A0A1H0PE14_9BACI|nr:helix-turn-helix domain-containing protein [Litchfieldia salsa]SDP03251.1 AraC-like ligand binding domain-containing protein [Litchfieldia salsa]